MFSGSCYYPNSVSCQHSCWYPFQTSCYVTTQCSQSRLRAENCWDSPAPTSPTRRPHSWWCDVSNTNNISCYHVIISRLCYIIINIILSSDVNQQCLQLMRRYQHEISKQCGVINPKTPADVTSWTLITSAVVTPSTSTSLFVTPSTSRCKLLSLAD